MRSSWTLRIESRFISCIRSRNWELARAMKAEDGGVSAHASSSFLDIDMGFYS
jgi:hypothetical protein